MNTEAIVANEYTASILFLDAHSCHLEKYALPILARNENVAVDMARRTFRIVYPQQGDIVSLKLAQLKSD